MVRIRPCILVLKVGKVKQQTLELAIELIERPPVFASRCGISLHYTSLHYIAPHYILYTLYTLKLLHHTKVHYIAYCVALSCIELHHKKRYAVLHYPAKRCIAVQMKSQRIALYHINLHYTSVHCMTYNTRRP